MTFKQKLDLQKESLQNSIATKIQKATCKASRFKVLQITELVTDRVQLEQVRQELDLLVRRQERLGQQERLLVALE